LVGILRYAYRGLNPLISTHPNRSDPLSQHVGGELALGVNTTSH
jgi:hypothetical protein